jgi:hypothetical protein
MMDTIEDSFAPKYPPAKLIDLLAEINRKKVKNELQSSVFESKEPIKSTEERFSSYFWSLSSFRGKAWV